VKYSFGDNQDRKFAELPPTKFKVIWQPQMIVFSDGSKIEPPKTQ
jgi:hypothetical protein